MQHELKTTLRMVTPRERAGGMTVVVLQRVGPLGIKPDHCIHGQASCFLCGAMCWLGSESEPKVSSGEWAPVCHECASVALRHMVPIGSTHDHRRKDGPHD